MAELKSILYVEDEPDIREITVMALEMIGGFEVTAVGTGAEATSYLGDNAVDLLLLDRMLPDTDGLTLLRTLRALPDRENTAAVFMSGRPLEANEQDNGWIGQIDKPFEPENLASRLREIWDRQPH